MHRFLSLKPANRQNKIFYLWFIETQPIWTISLCVLQHQIFQLTFIPQRYQLATLGSSYETLRTSCFYQIYKWKRLHLTCNIYVVHRIECAFHKNKTCGKHLKFYFFLLKKLFPFIYPSTYLAMFAFFLGVHRCEEVNCRVFFIVESNVYTFWG